MSQYPDSEQPKPEAEQPAVVQSGTEQPGTEEPGTERASADHANSEAAGTESVGAAQPAPLTVPEPQAPAHFSEAGQYTAPQYEAPKYEAPQYETPQYEAPKYESAQYTPSGSPQTASDAGLGTAGQATPQYAPPQYEQTPFPAAPPAPAEAAYAQAGYIPGYMPPPGPGEPFDGASDPSDMSRPLYGATFGQAVKRFFRGYAKFDGRASRSEFWWAYLFQALVSIVPSAIMTIGIFGVILSSASYDFSLNGAAIGSITMLVIGALLTGVIALGLLIPNMAIGWRRLHDGNFPGPLWFLVLGSAIPFLNYILWLGGVAYLVLTILPSKPAGRRFDSSQRY